MWLFSLAPVGGRKSRSSAADLETGTRSDRPNSKMVYWNAQLRCSIEAKSCRHDSGVRCCHGNRHWRTPLVGDRCSASAHLRLMFTAKNKITIKTLYFVKRKCFLLRRWLSVPRWSRPAAVWTEQSARVYLWGRQLKVGVLCTNTGSWSRGNLCKISSGEISFLASYWRLTVFGLLPRSHMTSDGIIDLLIYLKRRLWLEKKKIPLFFRLCKWFTQASVQRLNAGIKARYRAARWKKFFLYNWHHDLRHDRNCFLNQHRSFISVILSTANQFRHYLRRTQVGQRFHASESFLCIFKMFPCGDVWGGCENLSYFLAVLRQTHLSRYFFQHSFF